MTNDKPLKPFAFQSYAFYPIVYARDSSCGSVDGISIPPVTVPPSRIESFRSATIGGFQRTQVACSASRNQVKATTMV